MPQLLDAPQLLVIRECQLEVTYNKQTVCSSKESVSSSGTSARWTSVLIHLMYRGLKEH
jgi:hypothetical protein